MNYCLLLIILLISGCSTSKKTTQNIVEKDKSTTNLEQIKQDSNSYSNYLFLDTTTNSNFSIKIIETETTIKDSVGTLITIKNKETNITHNTEKRGVTNTKNNSTINTKEGTKLNQKNNTSKEVSSVVSTKTKANMDWLYWVIITVVAGIVIYFCRSWLWKMIKKIIGL